MLTGESVPVEVIPDDPVVGATVNVGGRITVRANLLGSPTSHDDSNLYLDTNTALSGEGVKSVGGQRRVTRVKPQLELHPIWLLRDSLLQMRSWLRSVSGRLRGDGTRGYRTGGSRTG